MTIDKAIKLLEELRDGCSGENMEPYIDACNLGIEALKRIQSSKSPKPQYVYSPLPGETET